MPLLPEDDRLLALHGYDILDTPPEPAFDDLAALARTLCDVPIALVSLIDRDRQWFKSCFGLDIKETPRAVAFCAHAIQSVDPFLVPDAGNDPRFAKNPLVVGPPSIRFYGGFPLVDEAGAALGTLCVIDVRPRELDRTQLEAMRVLAKQVVSQLRIRRLLRDAERAHRRASFVAEASKLLGSSRDIDGTLQAVAALAVPAFADVCSVMLCGPSGTLYRVGEAALDEPSVEEMRSLREVESSDAQLAMRAALEARRPLLFRNYRAWLAERLPDGHPYRAVMDRLDVTTTMTAPMMIDGQVLGVLSVAVMRATARSYDDKDLITLHELAQRASLALENSRLFSEVRRADEAKDTLLAAVSHDLRTPLSAIRGWTYLLRQRPDDTALRARGLDVIDRSVRTQMRLVEDLVDASRIAAGKLHLNRERIDLGAVVEECLDVVRETVEVKDLTLKVAIAPGLGPVLGDADRLSQVVWNLVSNAAKFSSKKSEVEIALRADGDVAELTVRDRGRGIDPSFLPHVFERFRQDDGGVGRRMGGLGLGLAIVKHIVEAHDGTITVTSDGEGKGATFSVRLPFAA
ncbi:MAG: signal transduction histidine kinase [Myxococcaceae bacterium]|nr:signal transduction histidine kinase [Myxococcaceae bacterium]